MRELGKESGPRALAASRTESLFVNLLVEAIVSLGEGHYLHRVQRVRVFADKFTNSLQRNAACLFQWVAISAG